MQHRRRIMWQIWIPGLKSWATSRRADFWQAFSGVEFEEGSSREGAHTDCTECGGLKWEEWDLSVEWDPKQEIPNTDLLGSFKRSKAKPGPRSPYHHKARKLLFLAGGRAQRTNKGKGFRLRAISLKREFKRRLNLKAFLKQYAQRFHSERKHCQGK